MFVAFIYDLPSVIFHSTVDIFADDTTFSISSHCWQGRTVVQNNLQQDINSLREWSKQNQMLLNPRKTVSLLLTGKRLKSLIDGQTLQLPADGTSIEHVRSNKLLGVIINEELNFKAHVDKLCKKLSQKIGLLNKLCSYLPLNERKVFYNAHIKPYIVCGSLVWTCCSKEDQNEILRLQKRAARVILRVDTRSRTVYNFKMLGWIPFYDEVKTNKCVLVYKKLKGESPSYIDNLLIRNYLVHGRDAAWSV